MGGGLFGTFGFLGIQEQVGVNCRILLLLALVVMLSPQRRTEVAFPVLIFCGAIGWRWLASGFVCSVCLPRSGFYLGRSSSIVVLEAPL